jgi:hypothetical protein
MTKGDLNRSLYKKGVERVDFTLFLSPMSSLYSKKQSEADKKVSVADIDTYGYGLELIETMCISFKSKNISKTPDFTLN